MKFVDFRCDVCNVQYELPEPSGIRIQPSHCGRLARRLIGAPHVTGTRLYSKHYAGEEATARHIDKALDKEGSWVPTPREAKEISQMTEAGIEPIKVTAKPNREKIAKVVEKAYGKMKKEGLDTRVQ
jgi:hypothetical protein